MSKTFEDYNEYVAKLGTVCWFPDIIKTDEWKLCDGSTLDVSINPQYSNFCAEFGNVLPNYKNFYFHTLNSSTLRLYIKVAE